MYRVTRHDHATSFLARAEAWLLQSEAENNLILGLARRLTETIDPYEPPIYMATVEEGTEVVGCALRTPPFKLLLTRMPVEAAPALVDDVARVYEAIPAVHGPEPGSRRTAEVWAERFGLHTRIDMRLRIYEANAVTFPDPRATGELRLATPDDLELAVGWLTAFEADTGAGGHKPRKMAERWIEREGLYLWVDGEPVSMAGWTGGTPNGVRVSGVYTPPELRRHGYATTAVATLTDELLRTGRRFCFLFTDLSNPTSNDIYSRIGYRPVSDVIDVAVYRETT